MPIVKETSARLVKQKIPYEIFSRDVVQSVTNPVALGIYAYLMTKPEGWIVRRRDILNHFEGLGKERYAAAMKQLKDLGLAWVAYVRDGSGQMVDSLIMVEAIPDNRSAGKPAIRENPTDGKTGHIEIQRLPRDTEITTTTRPSVRDVAEYIETRAIKIDPQAFVDYYQANGWKVGRNTMKDWQAAVRTWEKRERAGGSAKASRPKDRSLEDHLNNTSWAD